LARPASPRRCTLPITALRVTPPSSAAIWLAESPSAHSFFSNSTRSSVQVMSNSSPAATAETSRQNPTAGAGNDQLARRIPALPIDASDCPPHEMSYSTIETLQYGGSRAQESGNPASTPSVRAHPTRPHLSCRPVHGAVHGARVCIAAVARDVRIRTRLSRPSCPRLARASTSCFLATKTWMAATSPAMTESNEASFMSRHPRA
jgi:hypothetical protein